MVNQGRNHYVLTPLASTARMAQWSSYQLHTLIDMSLSLALGPSLLARGEKVDQQDYAGP